MKSCLPTSELIVTWIITLVALIPNICESGEWESFQSKDHFFRIQFPVSPTVTKRVGSSIQVEANIDEHRLNYVIEAGAIPKGVSDNSTIVMSALINGRDSAVKDLVGTLLADCEIRVDGFFGRDFAVTSSTSDSQSVTFFRTLIANDRMYLLRVIQTGDGVVPARDLMRFWSSFRLDGKAADQPDDPKLTSIPFGQWGSAGSLKFRLVKASVGRVQAYRSIYRDYVWSDDANLKIHIEIKNADERRIVRLKENTFQKPFGLFDDVENIIRVMGFPVATTPVGEFPKGTDIDPGETASTVALFSVPPPKTKFLLVFVNLEAFGGENGLLLKLPIEKIQGFPGE